MVLGLFSRRKPRVIGVLVDGAPISLDAQRRAIEEWASAEGARIGEWITVKPGESPKADKGDLLIVYTMRSLGESPSEAARVYEELRRRGVKLVQVASTGPGQPSMGC